MQWERAALARDHYHTLMQPLPRPRRTGLRISIAQLKRSLGYSRWLAPGIHSEELLLYYMLLPWLGRNGLESYPSQIALEHADPRDSHRWWHLFLHWTCLDQDSGTAFPGGL